MLPPYLRLIDSCISQLKAQGPSRTCNESKEEEEEEVLPPVAPLRGTTHAGGFERCYITQLKAQGPSRTCNESKEEEEEVAVPGADLGVGDEPRPGRVGRDALTTFALTTLRFDQKGSRS